MGDHESAPADIACGGVDDGEGQLGSDSGVNCVAAFLEDRYADGAGEGMSRDDGAVSYFDLSLDGI
jgi:hypothetical protein